MTNTNERYFRFNPFQIEEWTELELSEQYSILENSLCFGDTPMELAHDIDVYANMGYLIGEMIARYYRIVGDVDAQLKVDISNDVYRERNQWMKTNDGKAPAMTYFESLATSKYIDRYKELHLKESRLKRFKFAYDSLDSKMNALKKKIEAVKFDIFNK